MSGVINRVVATKSIYKVTLVGISFIWYLALFPGRLGFDYSEAIRMMQRGESSDWWTASFWWFLKLTSFNGHSIAVSSALSLLLLGFSLYYLTESLHRTSNLQRKALIILFLTPFYGGFGLNVSHDVFIAAAILIFTGFQIRLFRTITICNWDLLAISLAGILAITTQYGPFIVVVNAFILLIYRLYKFAIVVISATLLVLSVSNFGVTEVPTYGAILPVLADIKCVAQHPESEISESEWEFLSDFAPMSEWRTPTNCSMIDDEFRAMPSLDLDAIKMNSKLVKTYINISGRNSAIVAMAHFQRASIALPPPFFAGPQNQVNLDPNIPIGLGTNTALQSHAEVLHPSIDEPSVALKISFLRILEVPAQGLIFVVNQASWFWGWGGLWFWPILIYVLVFLKRKKRKSIFPILASTLTLHGLLLVLSAPLPRYVMSTIILGIYFTILFLLTLYEKYITGYANE